MQRRRHVSTDSHVAVGGAGVGATVALRREGYESDSLLCVSTQTSKLSGQLPASRKL